MRNRWWFAAVLAVLFTAGLLLGGSLPNVGTGQWVAGTNMSDFRDRAAAVLLNSGDTLITGGTNSNGSLQSADLYHTDGTLTPAATMNVARASHTATLLQDGRVLVTGGNTGAGAATNAAEIYDPAANSWTQVATMVSGRYGHTAGILSNGTVAIVGGQANGAPVTGIEIYDPVANTFTQVASLLTSRTNPAIAQLTDGRVIVTGGMGTDSNGNPIALNTAEIFDPVAGTVTAVANMNVARSAHTATTVLDSLVVVAGGSNGSSDLNSIEVYTPSSNTWALSSATLSVPRSGHLAVLLPHNNSVLITGGSSNGTPVQNADPYQQWNGAVVSGGTMNSVRVNGAGTGFGVEGLYLAAGGGGQNSTEFYRFATIKTDKPDYSPGQTVLMTGTGYQPNEMVDLNLKQDDGDPNTDTLVQADASGNISYSGFAPNIGDVGTHFHLTATGQSSGVQAQTTFTDNNFTIIPAPAGATFTVTYQLFSSNNCTAGGAGAKQLAVAGNTNIPGFGNTKSVTVQAPATSNQNTSFVSWTHTGTDGSTFTGTNPICVTVSGSPDFTATYNSVVPAPSLTSISPASGDLGQTLTNVVLSGTNFANDATVSFGGTGITVTSTTVNSSTQITISITLSTSTTLGGHNVSVTNPTPSGFTGGGTSTLTNGFTVNKRTTTTSVSCAPSSVGVGVGTSCTATVTDNDTGTTITPTGSVSFTSSGSGNFTPAASCTLPSGTGASVSCSVTYTPTATGTGTHTITGNYGGDGSHSTSSGSFNLTVSSPPSISKTFGAATIPLNTSTTLTFTITNSNGSTMNGVAFSDTLPSGLVVSTPNGLTNSCGGTPTATAGSGSVSLTGGSISGSSCTLSVNVTGATAGVKNNTTGNVSSTNFGTGNTASASITVVAPPSIGKSFNPTTIPLNGTSTLTFTITNPAANTVSLTGVAFTDTLPAGLTVTSGSSSVCGGTLTTTAPTGISLSGTTIAAGGQCQFSVTVTGAAAGAYTNVTGAVTSTNGGTGNTATANLTVVAPPSISKTFNPTSIPLNGTTTLTFTVTNPAANTVSLTGVAFTDTLPTGLTLASGSSTVCGGTLTTTAPTGISLSGATIAAGGQCQFTVTVTGAAAGAYTNLTGAVSSTNGGTGNTATANLTVVAPPSIAKSFSPSTIPLNGTSTLSFTITNPAANTVSLAGVAFTDTLPSGLVVSNPNGESGTCGSGTISAGAGGNTISLTGGTIAAGGSCTFSVNVTATSAGSLTNTTGAVTSTNGGTGNTATANLTVVAPPSISKGFNPNSIPLNGTTTLTLTVTNPAANTVAETGVAFTDTLPTGLLVASPNGLTNSCGGTASATAGTTSISLTNGSVVAGSSCTVVVNVTGTTAGSFTNTTGVVSSTNGGTGNTASASLAVVAPPSIAKSFSPTTISLNGTTTLTFTITNPAANTVGLTGVAFTDTLPSGLVVSNPNGESGTCGSGTISAGAGANTISLSGGTIAAGGSCTFSVSVTGTQSGHFTNTTGTVTSTNGGTGNTATANLTVFSPPTITKAFGASSIPYEASTSLTFTITNPNTLALTGVAFSDSLPAGLVVSSPSSLNNTCSGTPSASGSSISLSGGTVAASSSCTVSLNVTGISVGTWNNTTSAVTSNEGGTGTTSNTATLMVTAATTGAVVISSLNPSSYGQPVTFTATVTDSSSNAVPTGSVQFVVDGSNFGSPVPLSPASSNSSSAMSQASASLSVGPHTVTTNYVNVDDDFLNSSGTLSGGQTVNAASTSTTITSLSANSGEVGVPVTANFTVTNTAAGATLAPDGSVTVSDGTDSCNGTLTSGGGASSSGSCALTPSTAGTKSLVASYPGDTSFNASNSAAVSYMASVRPTSTTLTLTPNTVVVGQSTTASVTVADTGGSGSSTPAGTVSFASSDPQDALSSSSCTLTAGSCSVTVTTAEVGSSPHSITAIYAPNDDVHQGTWATKSSIPVAFEDSGADTINGLIYAAGGEVVNDCTFTNTLRIYNPATDSWSTGTGMPTKRRALSAAAINGKLYAVGGDTGCGVRTGANEAYDPGADSWTALASMPTPRTSMGVGIINGILYAVGGLNSSNNPVATVEAYDPTSNTWSTKASMPTARYGVGVAVVNGKLYAIGGGTFPVTGVVEIYDPGSDSWTTGTSMITPRVSFGTAVLGGMIYTIGGSTGAFSNVVEVYDPATAAWSTGPAMPTPRSDLSAVNANGIIYALGGQNTGGYSAANEALGSTAALTVNKADTQTTITANTPNPSVVGQAVNVSASVAAKAPGSGTPSGTITVSDGMGESCTITLSSGSGNCSLSPMAAGTITLTATYNGDNNYNTSTSAGVAQTVNKADTITTITANTPNPSVVNQAVTISATVTVKSPGAGSPTGTVTVSDGVGETCTITLSGGAGSCSLTPQAAGTDTLTAHYNGDPNFNGSTSAGVSQTIHTRHTTTTVSLNPSTAVVNQNSIATITVTDDDPNGGKVSPTGVVGVISDSGDTITGTCTLSSSTTGVSTCQVTVTPNSLGTGTHNITASFSATSVHSASSGSAALTVHTRATKTTVFSNNPVVVNQSTTVTVTVMDVDPSGTALTPTGTIALTNSGGEVFQGGPCVLSGSAGTAKCSVTLTPAAAGNHIVGASFSATSVHSASSDSETLTVNTRHTTTAVTFSPNPVVVNQASTLTVTVTDNDPAGSPVTPTGMVTLGSNVASDIFSATNCTLAGSGAIATCQVTVTPETASPTLHGISAAYPTDSVHTGSGDSENLTVNTRHTSTTVSFSINPVKTGESTTVTATVTDDDPNGAAITPAGTVTLNSSVGSDVFSATTCTLSGAGASASCTVTLTPDMVSGGSHTVTASYPADAIHSASTGNNALTVQKADTTTAVSTSASTITLGDTVTFTATVTVNPPGAGTPTGLVTFFDGATPLGSGTLSGNDQATFSTSLLAAWAHAHTITAAYDGDANFNASPLSSAINETVNERTTSTGVVLSPTTVVVGQPSTATVTVTDSGSVPPGTADTFTATGAPATGRTGFTSTLFADGLVLVAGGTDATNNVLKSAEIYSVSGAAFTATGNLNTARTGAVAVLLPNGKVLVAGGSSDGTANGALNTAELFDPSTGTFTVTSHNLTAARFGTTATLLNNGQVLLAGGANSGGVLNSAELYNPATDTFTATGNLNTARTGAAAVLLGTDANAKVLIAGGSSDGTSAGALNSAEVFDPGAGTFSNSAGTLSAGRWQPEAVLLLSGKVLVAGGQNSGGALASADVYDPVANSFTASASQMSQARANGSAVALSSGMVLLAGGTSSQAVDLYDEDNDKFDSTGSLQQSDNGLVATLLNNGDVLVVGLTSSSVSDAELYSPTFNPLGTVALTSSEATDIITGACTLTPSTSAASTCTSSVTPSNVASSPHTITGNYPADAVHTGSSNTASLTVNKADTITTITANKPNPSVVNQAVTISATVTVKSPGAGTPTGTVTVSDGVGETCTITLSGGAGSCSLTPQAAGTDTLTAHYNGDPNFNASTSAGVTQTIHTRHTTTTVGLNPSTAVVNQNSIATVTVTDDDPNGGKVSPTGVVGMISDSGDTITGTCTLSSSTTGVSTCQVTVTPNSLGTGTHNITASFSATSVHSPSSGSAALTVHTRATKTTVSFSNNPVVVNQSTTVTVTVMDVDPNGTAVTPTGTIALTNSGAESFIGGPCVLSGSGGTAKCSVTLTPAAAGNHIVGASFSATSVHSASSDSETLTVNTRHTTTAVTFSPNPVVVNQASTVTVTVTDNDPAGSPVTPTGMITLGSNVASDIFTATTCTLAGSGAIATCQVTVTPQTASPTLHGISAAYPTDSVHTGSGDSENLTVNTRHTSTTVSFSINPVKTGESTTVTATVTDDDPNGAAITPAGTVTLNSSVGSDVFSANTCTLSGAGASASCTVTLTPDMVSGGSHTVTANYPADNIHSASTGNSTLTVQKADTTTAVSTSASTITLGDTVTFTATVTVNPPGAGAPTGLVTFFDGATPLGSGTLNGNDQATFTTSLLVDWAHAHTITAAYDGDANFNASPLSSAINETVNERTTSTGVVLSPTTVVVGQPSTATVTVTDSGSVPPGTADTFTTTGAPGTGRTGFTSTLFADGLVLVAGGTDATNNALKSAEIYSVSGAAFTATGNLSTARTGAVAVLLPNGKVLVVGGSSNGLATGALNTAELFDPSAGTFTLAGTGSGSAMTAARFGATATLLNSGKVLIAGGANSGGVLNSAELYDPVADTFTATGNLNTARTGAAAVLLGSGKVLIAGGSSDGTANGALNSAEVFDPGAGAFSNSAGTLSAGRWQPEAGLLLSGKVLVAGGQNAGGALTSTDLYDPTTDSFNPSASQMSQARANGSAVALPSGMVLLAGGTSSQAVDLYDEDNDKFDTTGSLQQSDYGLVAALLNNGDVLVVGLTGGSVSDAELYSPTFNPLGTVALSSSEATDSITGACTLTPSTSAASTCTSSITPSNAASSPHTITGTYPADAVHTASSSTAALTVNPAPTSTTVSSSANPSIFGQSVTFTATVSNTSGVSSQTPTGTVQFYVDGSAFGPAVTISGSGGTATATSGAVASLTVNGSPHSVTASYTNSDGNFVGSKGTLSGGQTITPASTSTMVISSANPSIYGQGVTFTATVANTSTSPTPTGSVQFVVDGANFGPAVPLTASGTATSNSISTLSVSGSPHSVTANYKNTDGNFLSSSGSLSGGQKVTPAATSASVVSSLNPSIFGQSVTFTATITNTSTSPAPTGAVQFVIDGVNFGSPVPVTAGAGNNSTAVSGATATLTVHGSPHTVVANYVNFDGNFSNSSGTLTPGQTVQAATTSTAVSSSTNPTIYGQSVTFTATVTNSSGTGVTPTGSVQFVVDGANFGSPVALTASGTATSTSTSTLSVAGSPHSVTATYSNTDGNFLGSNGALSGGQVINPASTSTAVISSADPSIYGQSVSFTATLTNSSGTGVTPTGSVQFVVDGSNFGSPVPLTAGGTATSTSISTLMVVGSPHNVTANYLNTDKNFSNSSGTLSGGQSITPAPLTITASSGSYTYGGPAFVVTASYSGFVNKEGPGNLTTLPTCAPIFNSTGTPAGPYVSSCAGAVDPNYTFTYMNGSVTVNQATTSISVAASPNPATFMQLVTITATVTPQYTGTPTGTVTFYNNGTRIGTGTLSVVNGQDVATFSTSSLPDSGADNITAAYGGDNNFLGSTTGTAFTETVQPAPVVSLNPMFLAFGNQNVNTSSTPAKVTLSNIGDATLNISSGGITITGSNASEFSETNNCGSSLAAGKSCTINVTFSPVDTGVAIATLQITDNDDDSSGAQQTVALSGAGLSTITGGSLYTDAIFATANACGSLTLSGGSTVDSFNSTQGYNQSHVLSGGNVGTNGNVTLNGSNSEVYGTAAVDSNTTGACTSTSVTGLTSNGGAKVAGGLVPLNGPITYPAPPAPSPAPPTTTQNISGSCPSGMTGCTNTGSKTVSLAPGPYGNVTVSGGTTIHFSTGTYNINSLILSGKSILYVDSGPVVVNLAGASLSGGSPVMDVTGGSIQNPSGMAANLQFTYAGSRGINLSGGSGSYATVYAPKALVNMSGGTDFFGSIIGGTVTNSGGTAVHYDTSLPDIKAGDFIWFTAVVNNVSGLPANSQVKLYLTNSSISFTAGGAPYTVAVPNAVVTFNSSSVSNPKTSYDLTNSRWSTSIPKGDLTGNTFVAGVAFQVPSNFPTGIQNVTWSAAFSTDTPGITLQWQWGAAVYSSFSTTYATTSPSNPNVLGVNAEDGSADQNGADPAGTPEAYKSSLLFGATGGGLNNYIGFLTPGAGVVPTIAPMSVSPSSLDFGGQAQGTTSAAMTAVLTNNDSAQHNFTGSGISIMGTDAGDFKLVSGGANNCLSVSNLASGANCTLYVTFTPSDIGTRTAKIVVNDDANNSPQTVYMTGTGQ